MIIVGSWFILLVLLFLLIAGAAAMVVLIAKRGEAAPPSASRSELPNQDDRVFNLRKRTEHYQEERERILGMVENGTISSGEADQLFDTLHREATSTECPFCAGEIRVEAIKCKHCQRWLVDEYAHQEPLRRSHNRVLAGVCGGIAEHLNADVTLIRLVAVGIALMTGGLPALIGYVIAVFVMPEPRD